MPYHSSFPHQTGWQYSDEVLPKKALFGHIMRMDDNADAKRILLASSPADWRRQLGLMQGDMKRSRFSTNISLSLENDARYSHSYYERRIGNRTQAFEW